MSDDRLRELERAYQAGASSGGDDVAYLHELLRAGEATRTECMLAFRIARMEFVLENRLPLIPVAFDLEDPRVAVPILRVLKGPVPTLVSPPPGPMPSTGAIRDVVTGVLIERGLIRNPLEALPAGIVLTNPPRRCRDDRHLGPVDYDGGMPTCESCGALLTVVPIGGGHPPAIRTATVGEVEAVFPTQHADEPDYERVLDTPPGT